MIGKTMRVGATMFALLVAANVAVAQGGGGGGGGGGAMGGGQGRGAGQTGQAQADRLLTGITLTEAIKVKVTDVAKWYDDERAKLPPAPARGAPPDSAGAAKRTALTADFRVKLKALLTPEQAKTFDENVAAAAARGGRRGGGL
jgi:Spy/CpxP family protein refolding chaperone